MKYDDAVRQFPKLAEGVNAGSYTKREAAGLAAEVHRVRPDDPAEQDRRIANAIDHALPPETKDDPRLPKRIEVLRSTPSREQRPER